MDILVFGQCEPGPERHTRPSRVLPDSYQICLDQFRKVRRFHAVGMAVGINVRYVPDLTAVIKLAA
jgi:hypothetical protein